MPPSHLALKLEPVSDDLDVQDSSFMGNDMPKRLTHHKTPSGIGESPAYHRQQRNGAAHANFSNLGSNEGQGPTPARPTSGMLCGSQSSLDPAAPDASAVSTPLIVSHKQSNSGGAASRSIDGTATYIHHGVHSHSVEQEHIYDSQCATASRTSDQQPVHLERVSSARSLGSSRIQGSTLSRSTSVVPSSDEVEHDGSTEASAGSAPSGTPTPSLIERRRLTYHKRGASDPPTDQETIFNVRHINTAVEPVLVKSRRPSRSKVSGQKGFKAGNEEIELQERIRSWTLQNAASTADFPNGKGDAERSLCVNKGSAMGGDETAFALTDTARTAVSGIEGTSSHHSDRGYDAASRNTAHQSLYHEQAVPDSIVYAQPCQSKPCAPDSSLRYAADQQGNHTVSNSASQSDTSFGNRSAVRPRPPSDTAGSKRQSQRLLKSSGSGSPPLRYMGKAHLSPKYHPEGLHYSHPHSPTTPTQQALLTQQLSPSAGPHHQKQMRGPAAQTRDAHIEGCPRHLQRQHQHQPVSITSPTSSSVLGSPRTPLPLLQNHGHARYSNSLQSPTDGLTTKAAAHHVPCITQSKPMPDNLRDTTEISSSRWSYDNKFATLPMPLVAEQPCLREEDIEIDEATILETHSSLYGVRRRMVAAIPDLGAGAGNVRSQLPEDPAVDDPSWTRSEYVKVLQKAESQLGAREADLTIEALARLEAATVAISIYTEQREGRWMLCGPAPPEVERMDALPVSLNVWKVPIDAKGIVERGKLKLSIELAKSRRAIPCTECQHTTRRPGGRCPHCAGSKYIETIFVVTCTLRVASFAPLKLPATHFSGVVLPGVKYMDAANEAVRSSLLREQAINNVLRAARRVGQQHAQTYGARLLMAKAKVERRGQMTVSVTSSRTGVRRFFDVSDGGGKIVEISDESVLSRLAAIMYNVNAPSSAANAKASAASCRVEDGFASSPSLGRSIQSSRTSLLSSYNSTTAASTPGRGGEYEPAPHALPRNTNPTTLSATQSPVRSSAKGVMEDHYRPSTSQSDRTIRGVGRMDGPPASTSTSSSQNRLRNGLAIGSDDRPSGQETRKDVYTDLYHQGQRELYASTSYSSLRTTTSSVNEQTSGGRGEGRDRDRRRPLEGVGVKNAKSQGQRTRSKTMTTLPSVTSDSSSKGSKGVAKGIRRLFSRT